MKKTLLLCAVFVINVPSVFAAERHRANWHFGAYCKVGWDAANTPTANGGVTATPVYTGEGSASVSDNVTGQFLFATDGLRLIGQDLSIVATGLGGNPSSAQAAVIIPKPGTADSYLIFTNSSSFNAAPLYVTEVRKKASVAAGIEVVGTAATLVTGTGNTGESLVAIRHANGRDFWIVSGNFEASTVSVFKVVPGAGLSGIGAVTTIDVAPGSGLKLSIFSMAVSPNGKKIGMAASSVPLLLWDFNPADGSFSNFKSVGEGETANQFPVEPYAWYGIAFSPKGTKVYVTALSKVVSSAVAESNDVYQYDLVADVVRNVGSVVNNVAGGGSYGTGAIALGPDGKMYVLARQEQFLASITDPDSDTPTFKPDAINLLPAAPFESYGDTGCTTILGLPNFASSFGDQDHDNDGVEDTADPDADGDGIADSVELGGVDRSLDSDSDGVADYRDASVLGTLCADAESDGICDAVPPVFDTDGDGVPNHLDLDSDNDGVTDIFENGQSSLDVNGDGRVDSTTDSDFDGLPNVLDADPNDGGNKNLIKTPVDTDTDGTIDALDLDSDGDGVKDIVEAGGTDTNNDGKLDGVFADSDGDGIADAVDTSTGGSALARPDTDSDGKWDGADIDSDGDCILDSQEPGANRTVVQAGNCTAVDSDGDGISDAIEQSDAQAAGLSDDIDGDGLKNWQDSDSDGDGIIDGSESGDADGNGLRDYLERAAARPLPGDADGDGLTDAQEQALGSDPNLADSDGDGVNDLRETTNGQRLDTDGDGIPDVRDDDDDNDGIPTRTELGDSDKNRVPDYLEKTSRGLSGGRCAMAMGPGLGRGATHMPDAMFMSLVALGSFVAVRRRRREYPSPRDTR